jgi:hypothetical protein
MTEKERHLGHRRRGVRKGGKGAKSYDRKKAWSSVKHSVLSALTPSCPYQPQKKKTIPPAEIPNSLTD